MSEQLKVGYLTSVIDLFDRKVIGCAMSATMRAKDTSIKAFKMALIDRPIKKSVLNFSL
jgi:putative transposase